MHAAAAAAAAASLPLPSFHVDRSAAVIARVHSHRCRCFGLWPPATVTIYSLL